MSDNIEISKIIKAQEQHLLNTEFENEKTRTKNLELLTTLYRTKKEMDDEDQKIHAEEIREVVEDERYEQKRQDELNRLAIEDKRYLDKVHLDEKRYQEEKEQREKESKRNFWIGLGGLGISVLTFFGGLYIHNRTINKCLMAEHSGEVPTSSWFRNSVDGITKKK